MDIFSKTSLLPKKHHRCISLESGQTSAKKLYPKTPLDPPRFWPRRYSTPESAMRKYALRQRDEGDCRARDLPISNKSCQTDILGLDKYLQRSPPSDVSLDPSNRSAAAFRRPFKKPSTKKPKVRSVAVHCERRRSTFAAFKGCQKFKHVYKRKISLPAAAAAQPSRSATAWTDDGESRRLSDRSMQLPRLQTDVVVECRPPAAKVEQAAIRLPRIPTRDARPDRTDKSRGHTAAARLARMGRETCRPQSTGGSSSGFSGADVKLATTYLHRASSAPKVQSQYRPRQSEATERRPEDATTTAATTAGTRTVSTSTTFAGEPRFPIVFSCESVLRHPLDGGYVSHTESHRFSVHFVPAEDVDNHSSDRSSSLVFASGSTCQNEPRCLTGDSASVERHTGESDRPNESSVGVSDAQRAIGVERRGLVVEHANAGKFSARSDGISDETDSKTTLENHEGEMRIEGFYVLGKGDGAATALVDDNTDGKTALENGAIEEFYVLGKGDAVNQCPREYEKSVTISAVIPAANKTVGSLVRDERKARGEAESHAHAAGDTQLANKQNYYERLTQHRSGDSSILNWSPNAVDGPETQQIERQSPLDEKDSRSSRMKAEVANIQTTNAELTERPENVEKPIELSINAETTSQHVTAVSSTDNRYCSNLADSLESFDGNNSEEMALHGRKHRGTNNDRADVAEKACNQYLHCRRFDDCESVKRSVQPNRIHVDSAVSRTRDEEERQNRTGQASTAGAAFPNARTKRQPLYGQSTGDVGAADGLNSRQTDRRNVNYVCTGCHCERVKADEVEIESADDRGRRCNDDGNVAAMSKRRLESVDETAEVCRESFDDYVGGFLFGNAYYKKRPQKYEPCNDDDGRKYESCRIIGGADQKKVSFPPRPDDRRYGYYPKTRHSPWDEDCTVFAADTRPSGDNRESQRAPYYSQLDGCKAANFTDSDESLTDSLEDGGIKCGDGTSAVSYFLSLNGRESAAVTFTLKMPGALASRLDRRRSLLKRHLHAPTVVKKTPTRVRARHKSCQTLWTEEKGVQVQRGSTASRATAGELQHAVDDRSVLETLLAGLHERSGVSENQIRLVAGQKMVSEGNQTEEWSQQQPKSPTRERRSRTTCRDAAVGPEATGGKAGPTTGGHNKAGHPGKKLTSDNALMVGVVKQNLYKGKEAMDGTKTDQLVTLSKGWINFYTLRADSVDSDTLAGAHDNDDVVEPDDDGPLQYTVHVQAVPEAVTSLPAVVPNRNAGQFSKSSTTCSAAAKHLPRLRVQDAHHRCSPSHLAAANGWCVSVDGPNNMHMKVSLLPEKKSNAKAPEKFDPNEDHRLQEACRTSQAPQRKNNCARRPYRTAKRTQSTPKDMLSADVSRTESALSAESKYIETVDTQLLIHKARRRLSEEWDARVQNGGVGVAESVQLVVTGDSVSSRTSHQHYSTRGHHQHCLFRRQSRRI